MPTLAFALIRSAALHIGVTLFLAAVFWRLWAHARPRLLISYLLLVLATLPWWMYAHWLASGAGWGPQYVTTWSGLHTYLLFNVIFVYGALLLGFSLATREDRGQWLVVVWPAVLFLGSWLFLSGLREGSPYPSMVLGDNMPLVWFFGGEVVCTVVLIAWVGRLAHGRKTA